MGIRGKDLVIQGTFEYQVFKVILRSFDASLIFDNHIS